MLNCILVLCLIAGAQADLESKSAKSSGIIVNPLYDPADDTNNIKKTVSDLNEIVPPTHEQLAETYHIRNIINNAVRTNTYHVGGTATAMTGPKRPLFSWLSFLMNLKSSLSSSNSDVDEANSDVDEVVGADEVVNQPDVGDNKPIQPNLTKNAASEINANSIDSVVVSRMEKKPFTIPQRKVQREQLELISIEEDVSFPHGHNIRSWITINAKASDKNGLIGISSTSLVLVADRNGAYDIVQELDLKTPIRCFTNYHHWNHTSNSVHGIVVVEIENQLIFVSTRDDLSGLEIIWQWTIHSSLYNLVYFTHEDADMMLMINVPSVESNGISADIYSFDLQLRHTWLLQKIPLSNPCKSVAVINTYKELVLCFAQNNTVELYKKDQHASSQIFKFFTTIKAINVQTVSAFQMGGYSYLAITGFEPKIFRYYRGSFIAQTILSRSWGLVEIIFPIPARTYRDDLILLVQHRIMMQTHTVSVVEALIWDGESFDISLSVPCRIGDNIMDFGMTCMLDYERDAGIDGLSIIQKGNSISLIVPRVDAPSSMFRLLFELKSYDNPDFAEQKDFEMVSKDIEATTSYQNDILSKGNDALDRGLRSDGSRNEIIGLWNLTTVTSDNLILKEGAIWKIDEIYFGNEKTSENDLSVNVAELTNILEILKSNVDRLEKEATENNLVTLEHDSEITHIHTPPMNGRFTMRNDRLLKGYQPNKRSLESERQMKVNKLNVKHINVVYINDVPIENVIFTKDGVLDSVNSLVVENNLKVVNEVKLTTQHNEIVGDGIEDKHLKDKSDANNIHINGNLTVSSINGLSWHDFIEQIVMRNSPNFLPELVVKGDIIAKENIQVDYLNQISFPRDFLWMHDTEISTIAGEKVFKGTITADSVDTTGPVDGIFTADTISLVEIQHIGGLTTFTQLEITESLDVNGTINGKHLSDFKPNLSLLESNIIPSDCTFQNLQVEGPIFISSNCNGFIIDNILSDVVYKSNPRTTISSFKTFESVDSVVELTSTFINNIPVDKYMTTDTTQDINFDRFVGNVLFQDLYTNGLFDFINVTELDRNTIKLTGEQFTEAEIIFESNDEINIDADTVEIQGSFNGLSVSDFIRIDESLEIKGNVVINSALIGDLAIIGQVNGNGVINGISLSEFDMIRFSRTRPQDITSMYYIENAIVNGDIDATYVNDLNIEDLRTHVNHVTNLPEFLSSSDVKINNLVVDGNLLIHTVNGHDFNSIKENAVWLNQPNIVNGELKFLDHFEIARGIIVNNVNNNIFEDFVKGLVFKTDEHVEFTGRKIFQNEFHIEQDINVNTLNGIYIKNIWTKSSTPQIPGVVNVIGNLFIENLNLHGFLNSIYWADIENKYNFDVERHAHVLKNNVQFTNPTNIKDLQIKHGLNSVENIAEFFSKIIRKNQAGAISGKKQFQGNVIFLNNLQTAVLDDVDVPTLFDNIVINDGNVKNIIFGDVGFEDNVAAPLIHVSSDILAATVMDCSLLEWSKNALNINSQVKIFQQLIFPAGTFQTTNFELQFLNGYPLAYIITLDTEQLFENIFLPEMISSSSIRVDGFVNGQKMQALVDNSVMVTGDNYITASTTLQSARVLNVLQTVDTVNGKNLNNIATLHEDLHLYGPLSFESVKARSLNTKDTISGIDFDYWHANSLWKVKRDNQIISGTWTVSEGIFRSAIKGDPILNGIPIEKLAKEINAHNSSVFNNINIFNEGFGESCHKMASLIQKTQSLPYFLTHFEESFSLRVSNVLNSVHFFDANRQSFLVMNLGCLTVLYIWNRHLESYEKVCETETGNVDSWLDMLDDTKTIHLISNTKAERSNCPTSGLNVWKFDGATLIHVSKITESNKFSLLHKSKLNPERFLALTKDDGIVNEFDLQNNLVEQWHLPVNDQQFRFVPENANLGLALSNGKQLSSLSSTKSVISTDARKSRSTGPFVEAMGDIVDVKRTMRCPFLDEKLENATANCKIWQQAHLKALSNIGAFKNFPKTTQNRLLEDVKMKNFKLLSPIATEGVPFASSNLFPISDNNKVSTLTSGNETIHSNSTARDAFGDVEKVVTDMADNIVDSLIEVEVDNQDIDFDDSLIGSSAKNESADESKRIEKPLNASTVDSRARDMFGDIEHNTIKFVDKIADTFENIKDSAKKSQAKFHNLFKPVDNDHNRNKEENSDDKIGKKNLPKIPQVHYTTNGSNLAASKSSAEETTTTTEESFTSTIESTASTEESTHEEYASTNFPQENVGEEEPKIAKEIPSQGIATAENLNFPNHPAEEIVAITVGQNKKHLIAVSSLREHAIQGKHDLIRIYEDIIEGHLFQTLISHRPRSLSVLNIRDETILAFIENDADVQIFVYRGIQGFVKFTSFELPSLITKITPIHLPIGNNFACTKSYLAATMKKEIRFIEAKSCGYCGVNVQLRCDFN